MRFFYLSFIFTVFFLLTACGYLVKDETLSEEQDETYIENILLTKEADSQKEQEDTNLIDLEEILVENAPVKEEADSQKEQEGTNLIEFEEMLFGNAPVKEKADTTKEQWDTEVTEQNKIPVEITPVFEEKLSLKEQGDTEITKQSEFENNGLSYTCTKGFFTKTYILYEFSERNSEGLLCHLDLPGDHYYSARNESDFCEKKLQKALQRNRQAGFVCSDN